MVNFEIHNIFPTTVYIGEMEGHKKYKELFYNDLYPKYEFDHELRDTGEYNIVSETCGKPIIHTEESARPMMEEITKHIKNYYLQVLGLKDVFDVYHIKSWISRTRNVDNTIPTHIHAPSHFSYAYYVNTPKDSNELVFSCEKHPNEVHEAMFSAYDQNDTFINEVKFESTKNYAIESKEGLICIFPSKTPHGTDSVSEVFSGERLAISGDCIIMLKESERMKYSMGYINPKYWRTY